MKRFVVFALFFGLAIAKPQKSEGKVEEKKAEEAPFEFPAPDAPAEEEEASCYEYKDCPNYHYCFYNAFFVKYVVMFCSIVLDNLLSNYLILAPVRPT